MDNQGIVNINAVGRNESYEKDEPMRRGKMESNAWELTILAEDLSPTKIKHSKRY